MAPSVLALARSLRRVGAFTREGLEAVHDIWKMTAFRSDEDHAQASALTEETLKRLVALGLPSEDTSDQDIRTLYGHWQIPMYDIDTRARRADLATLRAEQEIYMNALYD